MFKPAALKHVPDALPREPMPTVRTHWPAAFSAPGPGPKNAFDRARAAIQNRYGTRAPQFTERAMSVLGDLDRLDPSNARNMSSVVFSPNGEDYANQNGIHLSSTSRGMALHEFGHFRDHQTKPQSFFGLRDQDNPTATRSVLPSEASATRQANGHLGRVDPRLAAVNGTYWEGAYSDSLPPTTVRRDVQDAIEKRQSRVDRWGERLRNARIRAWGSGISSQGAQPPLTPLRGMKALKQHAQAVAAARKNKFDPLPLLQRLQSSYDAREAKFRHAAALLRNPVASPTTAAAPLIRPRAVVDALDRDVDPGAGRAAYDFEKELRRQNLQRELPAVTQARQLYDIPRMAPPDPSFMSRIGAAAKSLAGKVVPWLRRVRP